MNENRTTSLHQEHLHSHLCSMPRVSWSAIVMGALVGIGLSFLLNLFGLALGLSAFPSTPDGKTAFAIGGFVGLVIFAILAMFPAGWVAGYLGRSHGLRRKMGEIYGFGAWALALILTMMLASHVGQFLAQSNYVVNRNVAAIKITDEVSNVTYSPERKRETTAPATVAVNPEVAATSLGMATFVTFFIFFIGMLSACFGGRLGMRHCRKAGLDSEHCPHCK